MWKIKNIFKTDIDNIDIWRKGNAMGYAYSYTGKGKESMDYSCLFPQCKLLLFDG